MSNGIICVFVLMNKVCKNTNKQKQKGNSVDETKHLYLKIWRVHDFLFYYIDRSALLENTPLEKFTRNYVRDPNGVFSISSLVRILITSFPAFSRLFMQTVGDK